MNTKRLVIFDPREPLRVSIRKSRRKRRRLHKSYNPGSPLFDDFGNITSDVVQTFWHSQEHYEYEVEYVNGRYNRNTG